LQKLELGKIKNLISALQKYALFIGRIKIGLGGVPRHPKGHVRV
jgi:hypothetical protein